ncbi:HTH domain protein [Thalassoglobus neptunius]|uniref:HTH domain protein n=1 Tax=Thalassoglobus neptunius TaxID=1938619 RepID=A0A5C5UUT3_9PLAN|nr:hypothetical protein [Thalassoglobus neptunius]TWT29549.1 HTH domain protein [Thalassoglobus neptunius]
MPNPNHKPWEQWELDLLGTDTDEAIAQQLNRSRSSVYTQRRRQGIPPHIPHKLEWPKRIVKKLGKVPAHEIAEEMGCSRNTVNNEIRRRGLKGYQG